MHQKILNLYKIKITESISSYVFLSLDLCVVEFVCELNPTTLNQNDISLRYRDILFCIIIDRLNFYVVHDVSFGFIISSWFYSDLPIDSNKSIIDLRSFSQSMRWQKVSLSALSFGLHACDKENEKSDISQDIFHFLIINRSNR